MDEQLSLPLAERPVTRFFFAIVPPAQIASRVMRHREQLCRQCGARGDFILRRCLHLSLHGVGQYAGLPNSVVETAKSAGAGEVVKPFDMTFDRAMTFDNKRGKRTLVLRAGSDAALVALHRGLGSSMTTVGLGRRVSSHFTPHMTLLYGDRIVAEQLTEPLRWTVDHFVLVHSLIGQGRHVHLERWPLFG